MIIDSSVYNGACTCGREHRMETRLAVVEAGCLKEINTYLERFGLNGYCTAVYDENTYKATECGGCGQYAESSGCCLRHQV